MQIHGVRRQDAGRGEILFGMHKLLSRIDTEFRPTQSYYFYSI